MTAEPARLPDRPPPAPVTRSQRSLAPDLARGAMLLFIALANVAAYLSGRPGDAYGHIADASTADRVAHFLVQLLMAERSRPMFAILYGFGIAAMAARMFARDFDAAAVRRVLRRRSWWLVLFGLLHAMLLFYGDILAAYGATGLIALGLVHLSRRALLRWFWGTLAFVLVAGAPLLAYFISVGFGSAGVESMPSGTQSNYLLDMLVGAGFSVASVLLSTLTLMFLPLVIAGMLVQRSGWLDRPERHLPVLRRVFVSGMVVNVASALPISLVALGAWHPGGTWAFVAAYLTLTGGMYAGLGYICGFALLAHRWRPRGRRGVPGMLAALGERSLTGYLGQSIVMAPLLSLWGFALGDGLGYLAGYGIALGAWALTVAFAVLLEWTGRRGPFEVLLRRLTYGRASRSS
ncbi:DUF418 domain-containing protein [Glycomyces sp. NRRL B-16210]|uniref:DUF418 domain-containing protein n=1 Tax=Glycomyces sp. NRRL B-16210 TaxID=1463821 RepID=UPI0006895193|nr:DUF418 domain-containing protein [Glycomyces sp. NRRL B-16210]